jgi:hypothetical protein
MTEVILKVKRAGNGNLSSNQTRPLSALCSLLTAPCDFAFEEHSILCVSLAIGLFCSEQKTRGREWNWHPVQSENLYVRFRFRVRNPASHHHQVHHYFIANADNHIIPQVVFAKFSHRFIGQDLQSGLGLGLVLRRAFDEQIDVACIPQKAVLNDREPAHDDVLRAAFIQRSTNLYQVLD